MYGQGVVRKLLEEFPADLKGFAVWLPMMGNDSLERADSQAASFEGLPVVHVWDTKRQLGELFARTLRLKSTVWDFYFLYPSGATWDEVEPPEAAFWMHQLPAASGADRDRVLYPTRFVQECLRLLGDGVEPSRIDRDDLGLRLHCEGLTNMTRKNAPGSGEYTLEQVQEAFEASRVEPLPGLRRQTE